MDMNAATETAQYEQPAMIAPRDMPLMEPRGVLRGPEKIKRPTIERYKTYVAAAEEILAVIKKHGINLQEGEGCRVRQIVEDIGI